MRRFRSARRCLAALAFLAPLSVPSPSRGDHFVYLDEDGKKASTEARIVGEGQGSFALELDDGSIRIVPQGAVQERKPSDGPTPITPEEMARRLTERFGPERFRVEHDKTYVVGLVLSTELPKSADTRVRAFLKSGLKFMNTVEKVFVEFCKQARLGGEPPRHPLVLVVFETDTGFEAYANESTGGNTISAGNIAGFYSGLTNWLAIRLNECVTFETPLHEAIHQQTFNRKILPRLAPSPKWFTEGIATGFEGNGERIDVGPFKINSQYARRAMEETTTDVDWAEVVANDRAFGADVFAGDAYAHAWCLHWMLCSRHKEQYTQYVKKLAERKPLETVTGEDRLKDFQSVFGKDVAALQKDFKQALELGIKRQKVTFPPPPAAGISLTKSNLAEVELTAVREAGGPLEVQGRMKNMSPIRAMTYHVTVETDGGTYAEWLIPNLEIKKTVPLPKQFVQKVMAGARGPGPSRTFRVRIRSAPPESREAGEWKAGNLPVPSVGR